MMALLVPVLAGISAADILSKYDKKEKSNYPKLISV
jgi:hypothetical protein